MQLNETEMRWLRLKWKKLRDANMNADKASNDWNERNDALNEWLKKQPGVDDNDPNVVANIKDRNLGLKDALGTWDFFRRDADRHASDILAFQAMKNLGAL